MSRVEGCLVRDMDITISKASFKVLGGLERHCLEVARGLEALGHRVRILTLHPVDEDEDFVGKKIPEMNVVSVVGHTNHKRIANFSKAVAAWRVRHPVDALLGFDCMPGLDFYYSAAMPWPVYYWPKRWLPRYQTYQKLERSVFGADAQTFLFFLADNQVKEFTQRYQLSSSRSLVLPPTLYSSQRMPNQFYSSRMRVREYFKIADDQHLLINIAIYGQQKGTDRAIRALMDVPDAVLLSVGLGSNEAFKKLAHESGVGERVRFIGYTQDIEELISASDFMVHPARVETSGNVIIESLLYGVPVISSAICGYSSHVSRAKGGIVLTEPFELSRLVQILQECLREEVLASYRANARTYALELSNSPGFRGISRIISEKIQRSCGR